LIRVLIADDQQLVREGLAAILEPEDDLDVVGLAADGAAAATLAAEKKPNVVLMDVRMPVLDGVEATRRIVSRSSDPPRILMLTTFDLDEHVYAAMSAGASGFLLKDLPKGRLAESIRAVAAGDTLLDPVLTRRLVERFVCRPPVSVGVPKALAELSDRELEVLRKVAGGFSNAEIAERLFVSPATVKTHVAAILRKVGVRDRVQLVVLAYESGLVEPGGE
jgi:DNA-binding NarL/FixJ family response regulator